MSYNPKSLFSQIQKKEQEAAANTNNSNNQFANEYILKPTKAGTMTLRLLWLPPVKGADRDYPMINSYVHEFYDKVSKKFGRVVCSTSQYMDGESSAGFKNCPVCSEVSKFYKKGQEGSASAQALYKSFRRTCKGYIPVYVINGVNANGEDISGQIKILQYGKQFKDFFNENIFGIVAKSSDSDESTVDREDIIGLEAFMYYNEDANKIETTGYDLIITTTTKPMNIDGKNIQMPQYRLDFSRKVKTIDTINDMDLTTGTGIDYFKNINNEIGFDRDFLIRSTESERQDFVTKFIIKNEEDVESTTIEDDAIVDEEKHTTTKSTSKKATPATTKVNKEVVAEEAEEETSSSNNTEDINVDDLINGLGL